MTNTNSGKTFRRFGVLTIVTLYLLILIGGIVRATGSGMGCPDWPKCFGSWVPPTQETQLPPFYREIFLEKRLQKNERVASMLETLGFKSLAYEIRHDPQVKVEEPFNALKTWIEYVNRLFGVFTGLFVVGFAFTSNRLRKVKPWVTFYGWFSLFLVLFQGWLGSIVVSANLMPWIVTLHMALALLLVLTVFLGVRLEKGPVEPLPNFYKIWLPILISLSVIQVLMGTQVREVVDGLLLRFAGNKSLVVENLDWLFYVHRSFSILLTIASLWVWNRAKVYYPVYEPVLRWNLVVVGLSVFTGIMLYYLELPAFAQPLHLTLASVMVGIQFYAIVGGVSPRKNETLTNLAG